MRVDICCCREVAVSKPFLNVLHRNATSQQQTRTAMPEVVKANLSKAIPLQQLWELCGDVVWLEAISNFIYTDVFQKLLIIGAPA